MSKAGNLVNSVGKIIAYILVAVMVLGLIGGIIYFIARNNGVTFYVEHDGEYYLSDISEATLPLDTGYTYVFAVKSLKGENVSYTVSIAANEERDFSFTCDGENYQFFRSEATMNDYTAVFDINCGTDKFLLYIPTGYTVKDALEAKYGGEVVLPDGLDYGVSYFVLTVKWGDSSVNIPLSFIA